MRTDLVREGYNRIAARYAEGRDQASSVPYLERLNRLLDPNSLILDLGCGAGLPVDRWLVDRGHRVIGLDISDTMLALAKHNVPEAQYEMRDIATLANGEFCVDAVVSFFTIIHIDRRDHRDLLNRIRSWMPKGGVMLITMGRSDWEGQEDFYGVNMEWSHFDRETNHRLIGESGFSIIFEDLHRGISPSDADRHPIFLSRRVVASTLHR